MSNAVRAMITESVNKQLLLLYGTQGPGPPVVLSGGGRRESRGGGAGTQQVVLWDPKGKHTGDRDSPLLHRLAPHWDSLPLFSKYSGLPLKFSSKLAFSGDWCYLHYSSSLFTALLGLMLLAFGTATQHCQKH